MIKANDLSVGQFVRLNDKILRVVSKAHVKPGKGGAFIQAKLKAMDGTKIEHRFQSTDTVDDVVMWRRSANFCYKEGNNIFLTDAATYEEIEVSKNDISKESWDVFNIFASEGDTVEIEFADSEVIDVLLPNNITVDIESSDPVVKGQTAAASFKNATIRGGIKLMVPQYITDKDKVVINLYGENGIEFLRRA